MKQLSDRTAELARHEAASLARCQTNPRIPREREGEFPIHVDRYGEKGPKVLIIHGGEQTIDAIGGGPRNFSSQKALGR